MFINKNKKKDHQNINELQTDFKKNNCVMIIAILKMKSQNCYCSAACNKLKMCSFLSMLLSSLLYSPSDWASVVYASKSVNQFFPLTPLPTQHDKCRPSLAFDACQWSNVTTMGCENSYRYYFRKIITLKFPYCYIVRSAPSIKTITAVTTILFFLRAPELKSWKNVIPLELSWESYSQLSGFWMIWGLSPFYPS